MYKIQKLELRPRVDALQPGAARLAASGRTWRRPKRRRAVAERQAQLARADWQNKHILVRVTVHGPSMPLARPSRDSMGKSTMQTPY
jgi:hypothetical protein